MQATFPEPVSLLLRVLACASRHHTRLCTRSPTVFTTPAGLGPSLACAWPHNYPASSALLRPWGECMTVHGGAQLHDVIGQGRHSSASFWRPLTGDDTAMTRPDMGPFHHYSLIWERLQHCPPSQISAGCRPEGPCRRASHLAAKCHRLIPKTCAHEALTARHAACQTKSLHCLIAHDPLLL